MTDIRTSEAIAAKEPGAKRCHVRCNNVAGCLLACPDCGEILCVCPPEEPTDAGFDAGFAVGINEDHDHGVELLALRREVAELRAKRSNEATCTLPEHAKFREHIGRELENVERLHARALAAEARVAELERPCSDKAEAEPKYVREYRMYKDKIRADIIEECARHIEGSIVDPDSLGAEMKQRCADLLRGMSIRTGTRSDSPKAVPAVRCDTSHSGECPMAIKCIEVCRYRRSELGK